MTNGKAGQKDPVTFHDGKGVIIDDNSGYDKNADFNKIKSLTDRVKNKTLKALAEDGFFIFPPNIKDAEDVDGEQYVLRSKNDRFVTGNVMGFIGEGDARLVIKSRFSPGVEDNENFKGDFFLWHMLSRALGVPNVTDAKSDAGSDGLLELLALCFPYFLKSAMCLGVYKAYVRKDYNDANVKGAIDAARHVRQNTPFTGNVAYGTREYSYDNDTTQLARHTIEYIKRRAIGRAALSAAKDEVSAIMRSTQSYRRFDREKVVSRNERTPLRHAYYGAWHELQKICLMILRRKTCDIGTGARQIYGILFDGSWLWEEYVNVLLNGNDKEGKRKNFWHPKNRTKEGRQHFFDGDKREAYIYPDFIGTNKDNRIIADAKYKPAKNIHSDDYKQILAYMFRFDAKRGFYLYPYADGEKDADDKQIGQPKETLSLNKGVTFEDNVDTRAGNDEITVTKLGLKIPNGANEYDEFVEQTSGSEKEFVKEMSGNESAIKGETAQNAAINESA